MREPLTFVNDNGDTRPGYDLPGVHEVMKRRGYRTGKPVKATPKPKPKAAKAATSKE